MVIKNLRRTARNRQKNDRNKNYFFITDNIHKDRPHLKEFWETILIDSTPKFH